MSAATHHMRSMLDELMGTSRDGEKPKVEFDDYRVCKCFFYDCCPNDILSGTRMDLGECKSIHDPALKADYFNHRRKDEFGFEKEVFRSLDKFLSETDKRVQEAMLDLQKTQEVLPDGAGDLAEEIHRLGEQIGTKLAEAENIGAEGQVQESLKLMEEVDKLNREKSETEFRLKNLIPAHQYQQQKLRVCEICSAYLGIQDNDRRLADHFGGKLHLGFIALRKKLIEMQKLAFSSRSDRRVDRRVDRRKSPSSKESEKKRHDSPSKNHQSSRRRSSSSRKEGSHKNDSRDKDRSRKKRDSDRSSNRKSNSKHRHCSKSKEKKSRSHKKRSRSREHRHNRSRSRDRHSRSHERRNDHRYSRH